VRAIIDCLNKHLDASRLIYKQSSFNVAPNTAVSPKLCLILVKKYSINVARTRINVISAGKRGKAPTVRLSDILMPPYGGGESLLYVVFA
jgi:hypothetical protein